MLNASQNIKYTVFFPLLRIYVFIVFIYIFPHDHATYKHDQVIPYKCTMNVNV